MIKPYTGPLDMKKIEGAAKRAYISWRAQRSRCYNPNATSYEFWGGRGVRVRYSSRDFIGWYLEALENFNGIDPVVSRIDHSKDYCFSNIRLESRSENGREAASRICPHLRIAIVATHRETRVSIAFPSILKASKETGVHTGNISRALRGIQGSRLPYSFERISA